MPWSRTYNILHTNFVTNIRCFINSALLKVSWNFSFKKFFITGFDSYGDGRGSLQIAINAYLKYQNHFLFSRKNYPYSISKFFFYLKVKVNFE